MGILRPSPVPTAPGAGEGTNPWSGLRTGLCARGCALGVSHAAN